MHTQSFFFFPFRFNYLLLTFAPECKFLTMTGMSTLFLRIIRVESNKGFFCNAINCFRSFAFRSADIFLICCTVYVLDPSVEGKPTLLFKLFK